MRTFSPARINLSVWACAGMLSCAVASPALAGTDSRLRDAIRAGDPAAVQTLIKQRTDVDAPEPDGATALHWAAHMDDAASLDALLKAGANPNTANVYGMTPLMLAAENGSAAIISRSPRRVPTRTWPCRAAKRR